MYSSTCPSSSVVNNKSNVLGSFFLIAQSNASLMRFLRAGYSLKYSEGFNPHPVISILLPLGVGVSSECELMDFQLMEDADLAVMPELLRRSGHSGTFSAPFAA
jgi:hypothetical protein